AVTALVQILLPHARPADRFHQLEIAFTEREHCDTEASRRRRTVVLRSGLFDRAGRQDLRRPTTQQLGPRLHLRVKVAHDYRDLDDPARVNRHAFSLVRLGLYYFRSDLTICMS